MFVGMESAASRRRQRQLPTTPAARESASARWHQPGASAAAATWTAEELSYTAGRLSPESTRQHQQAEQPRRVPPPATQLMTPTRTSSAVAAAAVPSVAAGKEEEAQVVQAEELQPQLRLDRCAEATSRLVRPTGRSPAASAVAAAVAQLPRPSLAVVVGDVAQPLGWWEPTRGSFARLPNHLGRPRSDDPAVGYRDDGNDDDGSGGGGGGRSRPPQLVVVVVVPLEGLLSPEEKPRRARLPPPSPLPPLPAAGPDQ
ncbi:hypothetical protein PLESTB_001678600 [Pleodorina starrii]|uniref:Uncharacterized protein n=1 Tax=Pleodorina starrii TaxID=330485 RepID=A0A9W6F9K2_9CHLO|nr:hypothetical protein PLESTB_001678600 [Pleodorina starrii]